MAPIRIKVQLGEEKKGSRARPLLRKFVYVIESASNQTIAELLQTLQKYIIEKFSHMNIEIIQLKTDDGFILSKSDRCSDVLKDNDLIICVDMRRFIEEYQAFFIENVIWLERKQYDVTINKERVLRIGLNNTPELFIRLYGTTDLNSIYVFGFCELITIANQKQSNRLIGRIDNTMEFEQSSEFEWFIECKWDYDINSNTTLFIICNTKLGSSNEIWSGKLQIFLDHSRKRIEKGELIQLSTESSDGTALTDQQRQRLKELAAQLPPPKRSGPQIDPNSHQNVKITKHECEGESAVRMTYGNTNTVLTEHTESDTNDMFLQYFTITHIVFSKRQTILPEILNQKRSQPIDKPITVANLAVFYQIHDGSWRECQDITIGLVSTRDTETTWLPHLIINIEPDKFLSFCIKGSILFKGICGNSNITRLRTHKKLPQPLKLKIVVTDNYDKQCSLIVEQLNKPLELVTKESLKPSLWYIKDLLSFTYADDCDLDERYYVYMGINKENKIVIGWFNSSSSVFDRKKFLTMEFTAKQNKTTEIDLTDIAYHQNSNEVKAKILLDPVTYITYALRIEISTSTSKVEETHIIPIDKIS
ncbi:hypothetical protein I4U23_012749 [Adineta vaga]|nr:hypothetical protein I4U23_012749 [Adineta vaga]